MTYQDFLGEVGDTAKVSMGLGKVLMFQFLRIFFLCLDALNIIKNRKLTPPLRIKVKLIFSKR